VALALRCGQKAAPTETEDVTREGKSATKEEIPPGSGVD
jgi:hypothetical protein